MLRRFLVAAGILILTMPSAPVARADTATVGIAKFVSKTTVESGEVFEYTLAFTCFSITSFCDNAYIGDALPPEVEFVSLLPNPDIDLGSSTIPPPGTRPASLTIAFDSVPGPAKGLEDGDNGVIKIRVRFPPGTLPGTVGTNTATIDADTASPKTSAPVSTTVTGTFEMFAQKTVVGPAVVGFPVEFALQVCSPDAVGGISFTDPTFKDTLPPAARFVSAQGTQGVDWTYMPLTAPDIGGMVTFINLPDIPVGGCVTRTVTVIYDSDPGGSQTNLLTATGTPEGCADPMSLPPWCGGQTMRTLTDDVTFGLQTPFPQLSAAKTSTSPSSYSGTEALQGETVTYSVSAHNTGFVNLTDASVTDAIPPEVELVSWQAVPTTEPMATVETFYQKNDSGIWISAGTFSTSTTILVSSLGLAMGDVVTDLRWDIGDLPVGSDAWTATITATVRAAPDPAAPAIGTVFDNCMATSAIYSDNGTPTPISNGACNDVSVIDERAIPRVTKVPGASTVSPNDSIEYAITLSNAAVAHLDLENPVIADLVPAAFVYQAATAMCTNCALPPPTPNIAEIPNYMGTGRTLLRWSWNDQTGSGGADARYDLPPGATLTMKFKVLVPDGTAPGSYPNAAALVDWDGPTDPDEDPVSNPENILLCTGDQAYVDTGDLDGDGLTTEQSCKGNGPVEVAVFLRMMSDKYVRGALDCKNTADYGPTAACEDADFNKLGLTTVGGDVDWRLEVTNSSNVSVTKLVVIDILPAIGDTGVIDVSPRQSQWRPLLQGPVVGPAATTGGISPVPLTVYYSTESNPCRPELVSGGPPGCMPPNWTTTFPSDPTTVRSLKLEFCDATGCLELPRDDSIVLTWPMVAPNEDPMDPYADASCLVPDDDSFDPNAQPTCEIAWNSFGFTAFEARDDDNDGENDPDALQLLPSEPNRVGIRAAPDDLSSLGDLVWLDVAGLQADGRQQPEEPGINGVRVELWSPGPNGLPNDGDDLPIDLDGDPGVDFRITGDDSGGNPGHYQFGDLPAGTYYLRFYPPGGYSNTPAPGQYAVSPSNVPPGDTLDSDGIQDPNQQAYVYSQSIVLPPNTHDPSWDQGLWLPTDYGDAPYDNLTDLYPVDAAAIDANGGNPADAGRHVIVPGLYLGARVDAELDGQPNLPASGDDVNPALDDEDGVTFPDYIGTPALPSGILTPGRTSTLTISVTVPDLPSTVGPDTAYLNAWIDFNGDGDWNDAGEQVALNVARTSPGTPTISLAVAVPAGATPGTTHARFRLSFEDDLAPTGTAYSGEVEDYQVQILPTPVKSIAATSEAHTTGSNLTIGEIVRYRLVAGVPEGSMNAFQIQDRLPAGLKFLDDGTAKVALVADGAGISSSTLMGAGLSVVGDQSSVGTVTPTFVLPGGAITGGPFVDGTDPIFNLGNLTNADTDSDVEYVVIEFNALVLNVVGNQSTGTRNNDFDVRFNDGADNPAYDERSNVVVVVLVEPQLEVLKDLVTPVPSPLGPGQTIVYEIKLRHTGSSTATAFDVRLTDPLPSSLTNLMVVSVSSTNVTPALVIGDAAISMGVLSVPASGTIDMPTNATVTVRVSGQITSAVSPGQGVVNTATVSWTSLTGTGTAGNPTGSNTPGGSGAGDGERDGSSGVGGLNDYTDPDDAAFTIDGEFGDLPDLPYKTLIASNGARHLVPTTGNVFLGALLDVEANGQPTVGAGGDDATGVPDDEDGITFLTPLIPGQTAQIQVVAGGAGVLNAWIDFNGDGDFADSGEQVANEQSLAVGSTTLTVPVPNITLAPAIYSRFRFTAATGQANTPEGIAPN
ncbi:MAG: DUF11 domain-containing protein, partial [Chloroflexi bacterium CFX6]|nr:DUF11 domain-containing protein [Chloroflexi bacterium CFX6]